MGIRCPGVDLGRGLNPRQCRGQGCPRFLGDKLIPSFNRNPYNGYINPYETGLMSLSPIIWKYWELIDPGTYTSSVYLRNMRNDTCQDTLLA